MDDLEKTRSDARRKFLLEENLTKVILITAFPQVIAMLIDSLYNMADTYFVSQIGSAATAAVGVNDSLMMIIRSISMGFGMGASSYISRLLGSGRDQDASQAATTTLLTAIGTQAVIAVLGSIFLVPLVNFIGATDTIRPYSMQYAKWILLSAPVTATTVCLSQTLRSEGNTTFAMIGSVSGCVINVILDPIFIGVMGLGVAGAAIATGISKIISALILFYPFLKRKCIIDIRLSNFNPTKALYYEIFRMGVPTMLRSSMMSVSTILINNIAASFGDTALAAISIANKSLRLIASSVMGFGQGFQPIAGYNWGAKKYDRVLKGFWHTTVIGGSLGVLLGALMIIFAKNVIAVFSTDADVISMGIILIRSQSLVLPFHTWVMVATGLFQALGKALGAAVMGLSRQLLSLIPSVLILTHLFGMYGLLYAQAASDIISFIFALIFVIPTIKQLIRMRSEQGADTQDDLTVEAIDGNFDMY